MKQAVAVRISFDKINLKCIHALNFYWAIFKAHWFIFKILLNKLYHYGVRGTVHDWFKSYLFGRTQQVDYNSSISNIEPISFSVPQGSILGPLLFIIYINDFSKCLKYSNNLSFADDTTIILSAKNNNLLFQKGNKELENIDNWLIANKLSLNVKKTKYILFSSRTTKTLSKESVLTTRKN